MAIIYTKGKKGLDYTGMDKVTHAFGSAIEKIKSAPRRAYEFVENRHKKVTDEKRKRNTRMIENVFGSVENYKKFSGE